MVSSDVELFGRKTFFIAPDTSLVPKSYLEEFMLCGFQSYIINDDYMCPMQIKIREIIRLFPNSILYFNVDSSIDGIDWKSYIRELQGLVGDKILIGIFYISRQNPADEESIKNYYIRDLKVSAGCFALAPRNQENFNSILHVLEQTGAKGRRSLVRAKCSESSSVSFKREGVNFSGRLLDVNLTHFRCDLDSKTDAFQIFDKIRDVSLTVDGTPFLSDAVLIMKRTSGDKTLCVFMFIKNDDTPDLEKDAERLLNQKIYQITLSENSA
ncbi:MAG: hypothetical protein IJ727_03795, partial [Treponema sp.]|nr:hypothetical protein [Treponema sp.]